VNFAREHNLRVAIKASGHDLMGRSTAKGSLLLWTHHFQDITFHQSFKVGDKEMGDSVTFGSGVSLRTLFEATKDRGKIFVGGSAQDVVAAGGYLQGAGHSSLSPKYGLAADNVLGMGYLRCCLSSRLIFALFYRIQCRTCHW
jgi:FAD/FMN-containing dehydrogenase